MSFDYKVYMVETVEGNQYHIGAKIWNVWQDVGENDQWKDE